MHTKNSKRAKWTGKIRPKQGVIASFKRIDPGKKTINSRALVAGRLGVSVRLVLGGIVNLFFVDYLPQKRAQTMFRDTEHPNL